LKIDLLGLGMLSAVEDCVERIAELYGEPIDLSRIPLDDSDVFADIQRADTIGAFQIESRAQMQSLLRTRPENLEDLTVQVALEAYRGSFVGGAVAQGVDAGIADDVFDKLVGFSGFGFPKSHAAAFGLLAYQSMWLRHHYPGEFLCALLNAQPMGFYPPASLV